MKYVSSQGSMNPSRAPLILHPAQAFRLHDHRARAQGRTPMWSWLKNRLSGHPTIESVAREAIALLRANGAQSAEYDPRMNEVRAQRDGHTSTIFLGNLFHE